MKSFRILGSIFCVFGCIFALLGILSSIIPMIQNEHLITIVNSFQETSADPLTNHLNAIVRFCLHSGYFLLFCGISLTVAGGLISSSAHKRQHAAKEQPAETPMPVQRPPAGSQPKPAYYPGGLAPPDTLDNSSIKEEEPRIVTTIDGLQQSSISGSVELALNADESDAQKLMQNDAILQTRAKDEKQNQTDYSGYLSNTLDTKAAQANTPVEPLQRKAKIVSTMGRKMP